jgi:hypothetical protein
MLPRGVEKMKITPDIQFVLDNVIDSWKCKTCDTMWIHFKESETKKGFFRLTDDPKLLCHNCREIDFQIEQQALITSERWVTNDD